MLIYNLNRVVTKCLPQVKFTFIEGKFGRRKYVVKFYFKICKILQGLSLVIRDFKKCIWEPG